MLTPITTPITARLITLHSIIDAPDWQRVPRCDRLAILRECRALAHLLHDLQPSRQKDADASSSQLDADPRHH